MEDDITKEELDDILSSYQQNVDDFKKIDPLDLESFIAFGKDNSIEYRGVKTKEGKDFLDEEKKQHRVVIHPIEKNGRNKATLYLNADEQYLAEIIEELPYGLVDKQITGIGATHLEMYSNRNSIIVTPTRVLAYNKSQQDADKFLYVGTKPNGEATSAEAITAYLKNPKVEYKKILVVADSLKKVIEAIEANKEDVYHNYFLLVDEIDTIQSDNHFRPQLSKVIDYYYKFKLQKRALVSATVKNFSHPKLQAESLLSIERHQPAKRNINLLYTNNINQSLAEKIKEITEESPVDKILIAYNSIENILLTIQLLPQPLQDECGILCSEASHERVSIPLRASIDKDSKLSAHRIIFMTCAFFVGIDIEEKYHLITVSNISKGYSLLPANRITQIYGRCRIKNGILSDTIIYNTIKKNDVKQAQEFSYNSYQGYLKNKANKVIALLEAADELKKNDQDLIDLFDRIEKAIMEKACEGSLGSLIELTRKTIDDVIEISYFNIDALCERMEAYHSLYIDKEALPELLKKNHNITFNEKIFDIKKPLPNVENERNQSDEAVLNKIQKCVKVVFAMQEKHRLNDSVLNDIIRHSKRKEAEFYTRVKAHYPYYDVKFLTAALEKIALENKKSYRSLNNALCFNALDEKHPFKLQICQAFKKKHKYSSEEIAEILSTIIKDQFFKSLDVKLSQSRLVNHFKNFIDFTYTGGKYLVKGYCLKDLPKPIKKIPKQEPAIKYFEI